MLILNKFAITLFSKSTDFCERATVYSRLCLQWIKLVSFGCDTRSIFYSRQILRVINV